MAEGKRRTSELSREELEAKYADPSIYDMSPEERLDSFHLHPGPIIQYETDQPVRNLFSIANTAIALVLMRADFWLLLALHLVFVFGYYYICGGETKGYGPEFGFPLDKRWPRASGSVVEIPEEMITFSLVFYVHQTYDRYIEQYACCKEIAGLLMDLVNLLRVHIPNHQFEEAREVREQLFRLLNAVHVLSFGGLPQGYEEGTDLWAFSFIKQKKILTDSQINYLKSLKSSPPETSEQEQHKNFPPFGPLCYRELIQWVKKGVWGQVGAGRLPAKVASLFQYRLWDVKRQIELLYNLTDGPIPFAYYHLLNFVLLVYLALLAYCFTFMVPYWTILAYVLILISKLGLRELGNAMSNPFGHDSIDLPVMLFVLEFYEESEEKINSSPAPPDVPLSLKSLPYSSQAPEE
eukprot:TRINITY_DN5047_c0_g1_i1.p1 TRINITY_DN5047_c0_g1~~TRINITY_DN5047_c0_g1_i1.p1  ORF type:complete len:408 (+),score=108.67 TRINITY_DN5047_c0_g1_i1:68-1291(+)